jgi:FkbM family methyltransferase
MNEKGVTGEIPVKDHLLNGVFRLAVRYEIPPWAGKIYWEIEKAYCMVRIAASGGELDAQIADTVVNFGLSTRGEYRRAKDLGGERAVIEALLAELSGTETVWDVGACVGTYTCFIASRLTTGCVVGFEPEEVNRSRLRMNLAHNASAERFQVSPVALSDENGTATLSSEFVEAGGGHHYLTDETGPQIETKRGDTLVREKSLSAPDVVKIDVQGAELAVLRGLDGVLDGIRSIYLEVHPEKCGRYGATAEAVEAFLRDAGYSLMHLGEPTDRRSGVYFVHASR